MAKDHSASGSQLFSKKHSGKPGVGKRILSFFTGCGGLDLGFEQAGFETVYATDIDGDSCDTLRLNLGSHFSPRMQVERADITTIDPKRLPKNIDLVIGGPPDLPLNRHPAAIRASAVCVTP